MKVDIKKLNRIMAYLALIEGAPLEDIIWTDGEKEIEIDKVARDHWKFTGLNNRDFALFNLKEI